MGATSLAEVLKVPNRFTYSRGRLARWQKSIPKLWELSYKLRLLDEKERNQNLEIEAKLVPESCTFTEVKTIKGWYKAFGSEV